MVAVLVDNARSAEQVQPLAPATARGTILVTSRRRLAGLAVAGFRHIDLGCFPAATGAVLLAGLLDEDRQSGGGPAAPVAGGCGGSLAADGALGDSYRTRARRELLARDPAAATRTTPPTTGQAD